jgi:hypothetical protein
MAQELTAKIMFTNRTLISYRVEASLLLNQFDSFSFGNHRSNLYCFYEIRKDILHGFEHFQQIDVGSTPITVIFFKSDFVRVMIPYVISIVHLTNKNQFLFALWSLERLGPEYIPKLMRTIILSQDHAVSHS